MDRQTLGERHSLMIDTKPTYRGSGNPSDIGFWGGRKLRYTTHALVEAKNEEIPILEFLPEDARLSDTDSNAQGIYAMVWKITDEQNDYFIVLGVNGDVITSFRKSQKKDLLKWRRNKDRRHLYSRC
jgi:hypothetical protein